jgi:peptidoglycan/LPS O-acetylase OafA/YrhL
MAMGKTFAIFKELQTSSMVFPAASGPLVSGQIEENNFNAIRLIAALSVLCSHSYGLTASGPDPISTLLPYDTGGGLAVSVFFIVSGYLVTKSAEKRSIVEYITARALRILPALAVVSVFDVILGVFLTALPLAAYVTNEATISHLLNFRLFPTTTGLPGVFTELHDPGVNGSLWTLPVETTFYLLLPFLVVLGLLNRWVCLLALAAFTALYMWLTTTAGLSWGNQGGDILPTVPLLWSTRLGAFFFAGACLYLWQDRVRMDGGAAVVATIVLFAAARSPLGFWALIGTLPYIIVWLALRAPLLAPRLLSRLGDISYGTYLFAFPVQQTIIHLSGMKIEPISLTLFTVLIVIPLAWMSFHFIERPALRLKRTVSQRRGLVGQHARDDTAVSRVNRDVSV